MFLFKRKNGYYYLQYNDGDLQKRISTKSKSKSEALKFVTQLKSKNKPQPYSHKRLDTLKKEYIYYSCTIHKPSTTKAIKQTFKFFKEFIGNPYAKDITTAKLNEYLQFRISNHSVYQARKDLINLRRFFHKLEDDEIISINPCRKIKGIRIPDKSPVFFTREEFDKLIDVVVEEDMKDLYIFAVNTGLRLDEIRYLKKDNIESKNIILHNRSNLTKTNKIRSIPLNITAYRIVMKRLSLGTEYIFTYRGFMLSKRTATHKLKQYTTQLGFNKKLNFHSFRHTFASWLVQRGVSIYQVSKLLGHANIKTTEVYSHFRSEDLSNAVKLLE